MSEGEHGWRATAYVWRKGCAYPFEGRAGCGNSESYDDRKAMAMTRATRRALRNVFAAAIVVPGEYGPALADEVAEPDANAAAGTSSAVTGTASGSALTQGAARSASRGDVERAAVGADRRASASMTGTDRSTMRCSLRSPSPSPGVSDPRDDFARKGGTSWEREHVHDPFDYCDAFAEFDDDTADDPRDDDAERGTGPALR